MAAAVGYSMLCLADCMKCVFSAVTRTRRCRECRQIAGSTRAWQTARRNPNAAPRAKCGESKCTVVSVPAELPAYHNSARNGFSERRAQHKGAIDSSSHKRYPVLSRSRGHRTSVRGPGTLWHNRIWGALRCDWVLRWYSARVRNTLSGRPMRLDHSMRPSSHGIRGRTRGRRRTGHRPRCANPLRQLATCVGTHRRGEEDG